MLDIIRLIGSIFYPLVEGIRIIGVLIGITALSSTEIGLENPRFFEDTKGNLIFSFKLKNTFNDKFQRLVERGITSGYAIDVSFQTTKILVNISITNKVTYNNSKNMFLVHLHRNATTKSITTSSIEEVKTIMNQINILLPKSGIEGEEVTVRIKAEPFFEYHEFSDIDPSRAVWGRKLNVELKYRL